MLELVSKIFDIGKLPSKVVALICIVSSALLFAPDALHDKLHTKELLTNYGLFVGLAFLLSAGLLALNIIIWLYRWAEGRAMRSRWRRDLEQAIARLDSAEKAVLREYLLQGKQTLMLPIDEPTVGGLISKTMIGRISNIGRPSNAGVLFPVGIDPDLWDALASNGEHLGVPNDLTQSDVERLTSERPGFMREIARIEAWRSGLG